MPTASRRREGEAAGFDALPERQLSWVSPPAHVWTMCVLYASGSVKCLLSATSLTEVQLPAVASIATGLACAVIAIVFWLIGARLPRFVAQLLLGAIVAVMTLLVAHATTLGAAMVVAIGYQTVGIYSGYFLPSRTAVAHVIGASAGFAVGLKLSGLSGVTVAWFSVTAAVVITTLTLGALTRQLQRLANNDPVTGLLNRGGLTKAVEPLLAAAARDGQPLAAVVIDLDGFKHLNDTAGHAAGDRLLADVATRWRQQLREADVLARVGGDEFVIVAPGTDDSSALVLANRLMAAADTECSAGAATLGPGDTLSTLVSRADAAMYRVKQRGRRARDRREASLSDERDDSAESSLRILGRSQDSA